LSACRTGSGDTLYRAFAYNQITGLKKPGATAKSEKPVLYRMAHHDRSGYWKHPALYGYCRDDWLWEISHSSCSVNANVSAAAGGTVSPSVVITTTPRPPL
jgi:hypothetical protein